MAEASSRRVIVLGATGTIGRAVARELVAQDYEVICPVRERSLARATELLPGVAVEPVEFAKQKAFQKAAFWGEGASALISCLASRTGVARDAKAVDYDINRWALDACLANHIPKFVLLSALCVQKPRLAFQEAKLEFERELQQSGLAYSIVRPTAFFKSLSGQMARLKQGKPYLMFGNGELTSCKPISDHDLARFIVSCLSDETKEGEILPIGGPGPAITPKQQGLAMFEALDLKPQFRSVPPEFLLIVSGVLQWLGFILPRAERKAELAKIGYYYATESMLVWDEANKRYDEDRTPEFGTDTIENFYAELARDEVQLERGAHAVF